MVWTIIFGHDIQGPCVQPTIHQVFIEFSKVYVCQIVLKLNWKTKLYYN